MTNQKNVNHDALREALMLQIQQLTNPDENTDTANEIEKANTLYKLAENMINIDVVEIREIEARAKLMDAQNAIVQTMYNTGVNFSDNDVKQMLLEG